MVQIPEAVKTAWENRKGPVAFATVGENAVPNVIYASCVKMTDGDKIVIADNFFSKTRENIHAGSRGAVLFITDRGVAYQVKGAVEYHVDGPLFDDMKKWNGRRPGHAAAAVRIEEVYSGAEKLM